jgi:hypothetical protein
MVNSAAHAYTAPMRTLLFLLTLPLLAHAELKLDVDYVAVNPRPEDEEVKVAFTFKNTGTKTVTIGELESACSCLSANLDKRSYQPGEAGRGDAVFKVTSFVGQHEKFVKVTTDDPDQPEWSIKFLLDVPAIVDIQPNNVQWWVGEPVSEKKAVVKFHKDHPMKITKITSTRENVKWTVKEIEPMQQYELLITPTTTQDVTIGALKIETDSKIPKYARQMTFFSIVTQPKSRADEPIAGAKATP